MLVSIEKAVTYMRNNLDLFTKNRLEKVYNGGNIRSLMEGIDDSVYTSFAEQEQALNSIKKALQTTSELCERQVEQKPDSSADVYHVISMWDFDEQEHYKRVISLLQQGLEYHPQSFDLIHAVAANAFSVMVEALKVKKWEDVRDYASLVLTYSERAKELDMQRWSKTAMPDSLGIIALKKQLAETMLNK